MTAREVDIVVTSTVVGAYEARSYPDQQTDASGFYSLYKVPVYKILVQGITDTAIKKSIEFNAPRFMPYFNDSARPNPHYSLKGWANSGLSSARVVKVSRYLQTYRVQNRFSPGIGAIVVEGAFYIHAGPASLTDVGFGSAGCIEIIGNYDNFKSAIADLSGLLPLSSDAAISQLVAHGKLRVTIQAATPPDIKKAFSRKIHI